MPEGLDDILNAVYHEDDEPTAAARRPEEPGREEPTPTTNQWYRDGTQPVQPPLRPAAGGRLQPEDVTRAAQLGLLEPPATIEEVSLAVDTAMEEGTLKQAPKIISNPDGSISVWPPEGAGEILAWVRTARAQKALETATAAPRDDREETEASSPRSRRGVVAAAVVSGVLTGILLTGPALNTMEAVANPDFGEPSLSTAVNGLFRYVQDLASLTDKTP